ncbi:MAG: SHOCT domain-containing protein [Pseudomonadota bacterium]
MLFNAKGLFAVILALLLSACAVVTIGTANKLKVGMTKDQAIEIMGKPISVSASGGYEYLYYKLPETEDEAAMGWTTPYYVRLVDGRIDAYGRANSLQMAKDPFIKEEDIPSEKTGGTANVKEKSLPVETDMYSELKKLKEIKDEGIITEEEYNAQKKRIFEKYR